MGEAEAGGGSVPIEAESQVLNRIVRVLEKVCPAILDRGIGAYVACPGGDRLAVEGGAEVQRSLYQGAVLLSVDRVFICVEAVGIFPIYVVLYGRAGAADVLEAREVGHSILEVGGVEVDRKSFFVLAGLGGYDEHAVG